MSNVPVTNAAQSLWEFIAAAATSILIHSIRIKFIPQTSQGVAQDVRTLVSIVALSGSGTGGTSVTPDAEHPRNTVPRCDDIQLVGDDAGGHIGHRVRELPVDYLALRAGVSRLTSEFRSAAEGGCIPFRDAGHELSGGLRRLL